MSLGFAVETIIPVVDVYVSYKIGDEYFSRAVLFLAVKRLGGTDSDVVPMAWDTATDGWKDARLVPGFRAVVKSKAIEAHYMATLGELETALASQQTLKTTEETSRLRAKKIANLLLDMIAAKHVRETLARTLKS